MKDKIVIYQVFTRLYGNKNTTRKENGSIEDNGCGKLNDFTPSTLKKIREMGVSHIWYTVNADGVVDVADIAAVISIMAANARRAAPTD